MGDAGHCAWNLKVVVALSAALAANAKPITAKNKIAKTMPPVLFEKIS
jgi:hypothetical protein